MRKVVPPKICPFWTGYCWQNKRGGGIVHGLIFESPKIVWRIYPVGKGISRGAERRKFQLCSSLMSIVLFTACSKQGTCVTLSSWSTTSIEEVAAASGAAGLRWFQLYVYKDREITRQLVERAEKSGYKAIVLTVDTPVLGTRIADARNRFNLPAHLSMANFSSGRLESALVVTDDTSGLLAYTQDLMDPSLCWKDIDWLRTVTSLPIILKGIVTREDAVEALKHNIQGIVVSNHGARQLDGVPATVTLKSLCLVL